MGATDDTESCRQPPTPDCTQFKALELALETFGWAGTGKTYVLKKILTCLRNRFGNDEVAACDLKNQAA